MPHILPSNPSPEYYQKQAKDLLANCQSGKPDAILRAKLTLTVFRFARESEVMDSMKLHHAQDVVAREYNFGNWSSLIGFVQAEHANSTALSIAVTDDRMRDSTFRSGVARSKGLPGIGTSGVSEHGVRYVVTDYSLAFTPQRADRIRNHREPNGISDLMPVISFPEMSDRLYELYIETDCVTSRPLIFIDTMAETRYQVGHAGFHQVCTPLPGEQYCFLLDASKIHETILAHELGHVWVDNVEQIEDHRHPKDHSDPTRSTQFYHVQSFVMDLRVNDMLERRGFDMSIIAAHEVEALHTMAANCARGEKPVNKRVLAGAIASLAGSLLEMERFPARLSQGVKASIELIQLHLPEAFEPAKEFVRSVLRHGYDSCDAVRRVVDECAIVSFTATGEQFDPETDLIEVLHAEPAWDKHPEFLPVLPRSNKREVFRRAAQIGITGTAHYDVAICGRERVDVLLSAPELAEPVRFGLRLDAPPQPNLMPGAPLPQVPIGSAYIPPPGLPYNGGSHQFAPDPFDPYRGLPEQARKALIAAEQATQQFGHPVYPGPGHFPGQYPAGSAFGAPDWNDPFRSAHPRAFAPHHAAGADPFAEQRERIRRQNEEIMRRHDEDLQRRRREQMIMTERICASANGADLKPALSDAGQEYARLHPRMAIEPAGNCRNYMAGVGLFLSRVGFQQQMAGEHPYGYAYNNPVTYTDPSGRLPRFIGGDGDECKERTNVEAGVRLACEATKSATGQACINRLGCDYKRSVNDFCSTRDVMLVCGSPSCTKYQRAHPDVCLGAFTNEGNWALKCQITLCTAKLGDRNCWPPGVSNVQQMIAYIILHEYMHCSGMLDHSRDGKDPNNPADDVARCILGIPGHIPSYDINIE